MKIMKKELVETLIDIECDVCGSLCKKECDIESASLTAIWGFDSRKDGEKHSCDLCEDCYDKVHEFIATLGGHITVDSYIEECIAANRKLDEPISSLGLSIRTKNKLIKDFGIITLKNLVAKTAKELLDKLGQLSFEEVQSFLLTNDLALRE
jgi:DNA-directed RNA polymerase alpha subunit